VTYDPAKVERLVEAAEEARVVLLNHGLLDPEFACAIAALAPCATPAPDREAVRVRLVGELFESRCMSRTSCERVADAILAAIDGGRS
jgi:hypothetical protein